MTPTATPLTREDLDRARVGNEREPNPQVSWDAVYATIDDRDWYRRQRDAALKLSMERGEKIGAVVAEANALRAESERLQSALAEATAARATLSAQLAAAVAACDNLRTQREDALAQRDACGGESIALRAALKEARQFMVPPSFPDERDREAWLNALDETAGALAAPSPSAEVMAARDEKTRADAAKTVIARLGRTGPEPANDKWADVELAIAEHDAKVRADALAGLFKIHVADGQPCHHDQAGGASCVNAAHYRPPTYGDWVAAYRAARAEGQADRHPARAPTVAPAAGEAKRCETCGGKRWVRSASVQGGERSCPECAPEKGGAR